MKPYEKLHSAATRLNNARIHSEDAEKRLTSLIRNNRISPANYNAASQDKAVKSSKIVMSFGAFVGDFLLEIVALERYRIVHTSFFPELAPSNQELLDSAGNIAEERTYPSLQSETSRDVSTAEF